MNNYLKQPILILCIPLILSSIILLSGSSQAATANKKTPNIVLILMDNFGYGEIGVYGGGAIRGALTPNVDSIAHEGFQLTNYNVEAECTPSRASLMTGRQSIRTRLRKDAPPRNPWYGITKWEHTLAELLSDAGYATGLFGKWHLGDTEGRFPTDQGFDEWWGLPRSSDRAYWPDSSSFQTDLDINLMHVMSAKRGEKPKELEVYDRQKRATIDREITDHAINFIERKAIKEEPFFVYIPYTQTHTPHDPHPNARGKTGNGDFADILAQTDEYIGDLLGTIEDLGIKDDTIVIFTSDNGGYGGVGREGFNGPWRGSLFTSYEGSHRVPFLIRWPNKIPARQISNEIVHAMDVYGTLAAMLDLEVPNDRIMDSADHSEFLMGRSKKSARESIVYYISNEIVGVKWRNWKMLFKELERIGEPVISGIDPAIYNLLKDPQEQERLRHYIQDTWVEIPLYKALEEHQESIASDPGAPGL
ncbi:MAG: arylsulfatase A-like enzyme [Woeseiaceae bacterium]|jgi:arylsulfatase A-like enzyme|tara:strand:+ start:10701 stop:12128 length:1428 start_codon:yes stop_codon:yes gene_type:complete